MREKSRFFVSRRDRHDVVRHLLTHKRRRAAGPFDRRRRRGVTSTASYSFDAEMLRRLLSRLGGTTPLLPASHADPLVAMAAARLCHEQGRLGEAERHCARALAHDPGRTPAPALRASIALAGPDCPDLLGRIHAHLRPRTYVEIGVQKGSSFRLADPSALAIGVDPEPQYTPSADRNHRVFRQTSDAFFAEHDLRALLEGLPIDL